MLDLKYLDLTDNSAHKCFSLDRQIPFTCSISGTTNNLLSSCTSGKSHKLHTIFDLKFSLICVSLELRCEMTGWTRNMVHPAECVSAETSLVQWTFLHMQQYWNCLIWLKKNVNITFSTTAACEPQLPFASSSADQIHIESQNNSGCKGLHNFNGLFNLSKLQSLTRLQRSGNRRKGSFSFVLQFVTWFGDLWFFFCLYPRTVSIKDKWSKRCVTTQRNRV